MRMPSGKSVLPCLLWLDWCNVSSLQMTNSTVFSKNTASKMLDLHVVSPDRYDTTGWLVGLYYEY